MSAHEIPFQRLAHGLHNGRLKGVVPGVKQAELQRLAGVYAVSAATIALAWLLRHPCRPLPIIGSRKLSALDDAAAACRLMLAREDWFALLQAAQGHEVA